MSIDITADFLNTLGVIIVYITVIKALIALVKWYYKTSE